MGKKLLSFLLLFATVLHASETNFVVKKLKNRKNGAPMVQHMSPVYFSVQQIAGEPIKDGTVLRCSKTDKVDGTVGGVEIHTLHLVCKDGVELIIRGAYFVDPTEDL